MSMMTAIKRFSELLCLSTLALTAALTQAQTMPHQSTFNTVGTVNCTSSTCHGSTFERTSTPVMQNEYTIWLRQDAHTRGYEVLRNAQSQRIAKNLGLEQPAHRAKVCLDCHSHNPAHSRRGERFDQTDGVNCEACHGPAEQWIKTHLEPEPSHQKNIDNGLYPTNQPYALAKLCLSCHQGDPTRPITHQIMGAGHPRLSIELETFLALQPPHYVIDDDWRDRKGSFDSSKIWVMGQFVASENLLDLIADPNRNSQGIMPEFMIFNCHACHTTMSQQNWEYGMANTPGQPRINDSNLLMVGAIIRAITPDDFIPYKTQLDALHIASTSPRATLSEVVVASQALRTQLIESRKKIAGTVFTRNHLKLILIELLGLASSNQYYDYTGAEQAFMSISSIANSLSVRGEKIASEINPGLNRILVLLKNEDQYDRQAFQNELQLLNQLAGATRHE